MRIKMTEREFDEIIEAKRWSVKNGGNGFGGFYDDLLDFHYARRTLPASRLPAEPQEDDQPTRGRR